MITVYTTPTCAYCSMVKKFLDMNKQPYRLVNLDENPQVRQDLLEKTGAMTVPITEKDGEFVVGWNPAKLKELIS